MEMLDEMKWEGRTGRRRLEIKGKKKEEACSKLQLYTEKNHE